MACRRWAGAFDRSAKRRNGRLELCECEEHVRKTDAADHFLADPDVIETDGDEPRRVELRRIRSGGDVVEADAAKIKHEVGALDDLARALRRHRARIKASELWVAFVDEAFFHRRRCKRAAQRFNRVSQLLLQPQARYGEGWQGDNRLRALQPLADGGDRLFQRRLARLERHRSHLDGRNRRLRIVGWNEDIGRLIVAPRLRDHTLHLDDAVIWIDDGGAAGRRGREADEIPEIAVAKGVMCDLAQALILIGGHADDMKHQRALGFRAHHAIQRRQFADPIGGGQHSDASYAGVAVSGVRCVQFVRTTDPFDLWAAFDRVAHREQVVPRDSEAMLDALVGDALDDVVGYARGLHLFRS